MIFPKKYSVLAKNVFQMGELSIVPIRYEDRFSIMQWRNEQIYHLRQDKLLTKIDQKNYFQNVVAQLFEKNQPEQILFSFLKDKECIGYGGLVHINWIDRNAEISFIMETSQEKEHFSEYWKAYLKLIEKVAFEELNLHKIYTYAFDLRPHLYEAFEKAGFKKEAVLKEHCLFEGKFIDVVIHSKINSLISIRLAKEDDVFITYEWANDTMTRKNSFHSEAISLEDHKNWWKEKMVKKMNYFIGEYQNQPAALIRFDEEDDNFVIGITVAPAFRGRHLAFQFINESCKKMSQQFKKSIFAYIKKENIASLKSFERADFRLIDEEEINQVTALKYEYSFKNIEK